MARGEFGTVQRQQGGENVDESVQAPSVVATNVPDGFMSTVQPVQNQTLQGELVPGGDMHPDRLASVSHMLMDEEFMAMDRIISLDDMIFAGSEPHGNSLAWASNGQT
jgi:hypothetical protein